MNCLHNTCQFPRWILRHFALNLMWFSTTHTQCCWADLWFGRPVLIQCDGHAMIAMTQYKQRIYTCPCHTMHAMWWPIESLIHTTAHTHTYMHAFTFKSHTWICIIYIIFAKYFGGHVGCDSMWPPHQRRISATSAPHQRRTGHALSLSSH